MNKSKETQLRNLKYIAPPKTLAAKIGDSCTVGDLTFEKQRSGGWKLVTDTLVRDWLSYLYVELNLSMNEVIAQTGISNSTLQRLLNELGLMRSTIKIREQCESVVETHFDELKRLNTVCARPIKYLKWWIHKETGLHLTPGQISRAMSKLGHTVLTPVEVYKAVLTKNKDSVLSMYEQGHTVTKITRTINDCNGNSSFTMQATYVRDFLKDAGVYDGSRRCGKRLKSMGVHSMSPIEKHYTGSFGDNPTRVQFALGVDLKQLTYSEYKRLITYLTTYLKAELPEQYSQFKNTKHSGLHLDHKFSKMMGFYYMDHSIGDYVPREDPIPLHVMCHPDNLELITSRANMMKGSACTIDYADLIKSVKKSKFNLIRAAKEL